MKKIIKNILLSIPLAFALGCQSPLTANKEIEISKLTSDVHNNIGYSTTEEPTKIQSPEETLRRKTGDCKDMTILLMKKSHDELGINPYFLFFFGTPYYNDKQILGHSIMEYGGIYYDATNNVSTTPEGYKKFYNIFFSWELNYDDAMSWIKN